MNSAKAIAVVLVLLPTLVLAQKKPKKPSLPAVFDQAHLVYVEAVEGEEFKPGLPTEERIAIADVRDALRQWGRYTYTPEREKAELVFVVRKGRPASARGGADIGGDADEMGATAGPANGGPMMGRQQAQGQRSQGPPATMGADAGPQDDMLEVCQIKVNGKLTSPLWSHSLQNGLSAPRMLLLVQLKQDVERAYPKAPDAQPAKP